MGVVTVDPGAIGADWAYLGTKTPAVLKAHNVTFCTRYITRGNSSKALQWPERDMLLAAGVAITLCWETSATAALGGAAQGRADGIEAAHQATLIGYPIGLAILAAVDTDVVAANSVLVREYLLAFYANCAPYGPGLYGDEDAFALVADYDPVWCLPNALGWSPILRRWFAGLLKIFGFGFKGHIRQGREDTTLGWDYPNVCTKAFPAWGPNKPAAPQPPPVVIPPESPAPIQEDDMSNVLYVSAEPAGIPDHFDAQFFGLSNGRASLWIEWTGSGDDPVVLKRIADHKACGLQVTPVHRADLRNCTLIGPVPPGWSKDPGVDFAKVIG